MMGAEGLRAVKGFRYAAARLDNTPRLNIGLLFSDVKETIGTAVYTKSDIKAAPVLISREMDTLSTRKRAIFINSGVANAFTGQEGLRSAHTCIEAVAKSLGIQREECYIASTGVIGKKLDPSITDHIAYLVNSLSSEQALDFIKASMTTDTKIKQANVAFKIGDKTVNIAACAKGSGMIMPDMATMLSCIISDVAITHDILSAALIDTVENTYNCITVDGDTSTNDSVFILANAMAYSATIS